MYIILGHKSLPVERDTDQPTDGQMERRDRRSDGWTEATDGRTDGWNEETEGWTAVSIKCFHSFALFQVEQSSGGWLRI